MLALLAAGLVLGVGAAVTLAAWNDSEVATGSFTASTFATEAKDTASGTWAQTSDGSPATLTFNATGLYPGAIVYAGLDVRTTAATNIAGTALLSAAAPSGDSALTGELEYRVVVLTGAGALSTACSAASYSGAFLSVSSVPSGGGAVQAALAASASSPVRFCFQVQMKSAAATGAQGRTGSVKWTVATASTP